MEIDEVSGGASELEEEFAIFPWIFSRKLSLSLSLSPSLGPNTVNPISTEERLLLHSSVL